MVQSISLWGCAVLGRIVANWRGGALNLGGCGSCRGWGVGWRRGQRVAYLLGNRISHESGSWGTVFGASRKWARATAIGLENPEIGRSKEIKSRRKRPHERENVR